MDFSNLGVALGAGVDEYNNQRRMAREDAREKRDAEQFGMQKEQFGWQRDAEKRKSEIQQRQDAVMRAAQANAGFLQELDSLPDDKLGEFTGRVSQHYNQDPAWANGMYANLTNVEGKPYVVHGNMAKLGGVQMIPVTREGIRGALGQMNDDLQRRLALAGGAETYMPYADKQREFGIKDRQAHADETKAGAAVKQADTMEGYRLWQQNQPRLERNALGQTMAISPDGRTLLATHGPELNPYAHLGGGAGGAKHDWVPMGEDSDGQVVFFDKKASVDPRNPAGMFLRPDGKPVSDVSGLYRKLTGTVPEKQAPAIPKEAVTEFSKVFFAADPKTQQALKLQNPMLAAMVTGGSPALKVGKGAGTPQAEPEQAPTEPYATRRGLGFVVVDPVRKTTMPIADYERQTGNAWADLPIR